MNTKLIIGILLFFNIIYSQTEQCGTMKNLEEQIKKDPSLKARLIEIENTNREWIEKNGLGFKKHLNIENTEKLGNISKSTLSTNSLCGYNNTYFTSITAPTSIGNIISPTPNCTYGGEYVRVNNLIAGRTYRISTIGINIFDTQITIYPAGGGSAVAFNDDWNGSLQSEIYFTPIFTGNYDVLVNPFGCGTNQLCSSLQVELWYVPRPVVTIPVVVHIIHNGEEIGVGDNISDAQIQSQIDVLNEDFRRFNADILSVPAAFRGTSTDPLIQFCLAQQTPEGTITNGITRRLKPTQSDYNQLSYPVELQCLNINVIEQVIKPSTIWNRDKYLNIWVSDMRRLPPVVFGQPNNDPDNNQGCNFQAITLGYAQFPGLGGLDPAIPANLTDGVWIRTDVFGRIGNLDPHFNLGRTTTHEVGHWLHLMHIWGNESACGSDDEVIDTPKQTNKSSGCIIFPTTDACSLNYPGIMFPNFMDYSDDNCLGLFTYGQTVRMDAALFNQRASLLTSQGCIPGNLSSNEVVFNSIALYPNPTNTKVFFDNSNEKFKSISIFNYLGQLVGKKQFISFDSNQEIDLSNLSNGVYILKFSNGEITKSVKIIKE